MSMGFVRESFGPAQTAPLMGRNFLLRMSISALSYVSLR